MAIALTMSAACFAEGGDDASRQAFRTCDAQAFLALSMARNYLMSGRNKALVAPYLEGSAEGQAMAEELYRRVDAGEIHQPGQFAADVLFRCAQANGLRVGTTRPRAALCFTRTDVPFFMHSERSQHVIRQRAISNVLARLTVRELYPTALVQQVAEAVYAPPELPDLRRLMGAVAWSCINEPRKAAASAPGG